MIDIRSDHRWRVCRTKSKGKPTKRWVAWRLRGKKKSGVVFTSWSAAIYYAYLMAGVDRRMHA